ncbi:MAG: hypothetical protein QOH31_636 [Verrucomicrobiota bacterium]|jgi:hypothetical protein
MRAHPAILEAGQLSGFYGDLECLKNIADFLDLATDQFAISWRIQNYTWNAPAFLVTPRDFSIRSAATESPLALAIAFCSLRALPR